MYKNSVRVSEIETILPDSPGLYAFYLDENVRLPDLFAEELRLLPDNRLLYVGQASRSLYERVWNQECRHRSPGTFFRSIGVMLGFISPAGGKNFKFAPDDQNAIKAWIANSLRVAWSHDPVADEIGPAEKAIIKAMTPLLNLKDNPRKFQELERLRTISRGSRQR
jgi:hypothetical protein